MAKVLDVAKYFLLLNQRLNDSIKREDDNNDDFETTPDPISHLKIQKLVYYAQGWHLAYFGKPLFKEEIQAWLHGPVVNELYQQLKDYKDNDLMLHFKDIQEDNLNLTEDEKWLISATLEKYKGYSASGLRNKTHTESPWLNTFEKGKSNTISVESIQNFFLRKINNHELPLKYDFIEDKKEKIIALATKIRNDCVYPVDPIIIAGGMGFSVYIKDLKEDELGKILLKDKKIVINSHLSFLKQVFLVAHQLGYYSLYGQEAVYGGVQDYTLKKYILSQREQSCVCDYFAYNLLMPKEEIERILELNRTSYNIDAIAKYFDVSSSDARFWLKELGIDFNE